MRLLLGIVAILLIAPLAASAQVIHACVKQGGTVKIVADSADCRPVETPLSWNVQGPAGPQGPPGEPGPQGPPGAETKGLAYSLATPVTAFGSEVPIEVRINPESEKAGPINCLLFICSQDNDVLFFSVEVTVAPFSSALDRVAVRIPGIDFGDLRGAGSIAGTEGSNSPLSAEVDEEGRVVLRFGAPRLEEGGVSEVLFVAVAAESLGTSAEVEFSVSRATSLPLGEPAIGALTLTP